jgi:hypothetical protein
MDYSKAYDNNCVLATADCGCEIVLSRVPKDEAAPHVKQWVKFCEGHGAEKTPKKGEALCQLKK